MFVVLCSCAVFFHVFYVMMCVVVVVFSVLCCLILCFYSMWLFFVFIFFSNPHHVSQEILPGGPQKSSLEVPRNHPWGGLEIHWEPLAETQNANLRKSLPESLLGNLPGPSRNLSDSRFFASSKTQRVCTNT